MKSICRRAMAGLKATAIIPRHAHPFRPEKPVRATAEALARRRFLKFVVTAAALPTASRFAWAQAYPSRPITMIVPVAAGSISDLTGRVVAERMRASLGQPIIIENVSGAEGTIGTGRAARATPDGYTIVFGFGSAMALNAAIYSLPYDLLNDFEPIGPLVTNSLVLFARKTMPANDLGELIAWLEANPNKASAGSSSSGFHMVTGIFQKETRTQFILVPYRGGSPAMQDLLAGQIDLLFGSPDNLPLARAGSIKAYAITGDKRMIIAPDIPTFAELGLPAISFGAWYGLFAPKATPKDVIGKLNAAAMDALADPAVQARLLDFGMEPFPREQQTPEALHTLQKIYARKWLPIIKELGIKAE